MALRPNNNYRGNRREEEPYRINQLIRGVEEVRLVGENVEQGVYEFSKAIAMAEAQSLDLVEISPNAVPPVCKIKIARTTIISFKQMDLENNKEKAFRVNFYANTSEKNRQSFFF